MNKVTCFRLAVAGLSLSLSLPVAGHHPVQAKFDEERPLTLEGRVTEVDWANPHVHIFMNVEDGGAAPVNWAVELESPVTLEWSGWQPEDLRIGEVISVRGSAARDGSLQVWADSIRGAGGEPLFEVDGNAIAARLENRPQGPTPRWPDGQPRLGPPPGQTGYWTSAEPPALVEDGVELGMEAHGLLLDLADAPRVAPFQPWSRALYERRQQSHLQDDPLFLHCIPPGGPRQFQMPYGFQLVEERDRERIFVLMGAGNSNWRLIYLDGREQVGQVAGDDDNPLFFGRSVGRWEGDTLVVDTTGFNETFWFANGGLPHTSLLRLQERFTRPDLNTLRYSVTVDDPGAYTRPWTSSWELQWVPGEELPEYYCQDNRP